MYRNQKVLYVVLLTGCVAGYFWVWWSAQSPDNESTVCLIKNVTGLPCPSCGSTRAVVSLAQGDLVGALQWNPLGLIIAAVLLVAPWWMGYDFLTNQKTLPAFVAKAEHLVQKKWVAAPAIILVLANWIWNFSKGL